MNAVFPPWPIREFLDRSDGIPESGREDSIFRGAGAFFGRTIHPTRRAGMFMRTSRRISRTGLRKPLKSGPSMIEPEATECVDRPSHPLLATDKSTASLLCCRLDPVAHVVPAVVVYPIVCGVNFREQDFSSVLVYLPFAERIGPPRIRKDIVLPSFHGRGTWLSHPASGWPNQDRISRSACRSQTMKVVLRTACLMSSLWSSLRANLRLIDSMV